MIKPYYQRRKKLRKELNQSRISDHKSHCKVRLAKDSKKCGLTMTDKVKRNENFLWIGSRDE